MIISTQARRPERNTVRPRAGALTASFGLAVLVAGCGTGGAAPTDAPSPSATPNEPTATSAANEGFVLQVARVGGFQPASAAFSEVPMLTVYADGSAITHGPQIAIYPEPALPNLLVQMLPAEEMDALIELARAAGLLTDPPDYGSPPIADAATTVVTLNIDETTYVHEAYALGTDLVPPGGGEPSPSVGGDAGAARDDLLAFINAATSLVGDDDAAAPYEPDAFAIRSSPAVPDETPAGSASAPPDIEPGVEPWPIADIDLEQGDGCRIVADTAAETLREALAAANQLTRFEQDGALYDIAVRPLLPHEHSCDDIT